MSNSAAFRGEKPAVKPESDAPATFRLAAVPRPALALGLAGLIPFFAGAAAVHLAEPQWIVFARSALAGYGAVILSFLGGARWGLACAGVDREGPSWWRLSVSVTPALIAWAALAAGAQTALLVGALGLIGLFAADVSLTRAGGAPAWWPALRLPLTVGAAASLLIGAI